jgi:integrase
MRGNGETDLHGLRLHDLRHSFASLAIRDGIPFTVIGKLLGHALPETTARHAHLADDAGSEEACCVCGSIAAKLGMSS